MRPHFCVGLQVLLAEALSVVAYMARNIPQLICEFASSRLEDNPLAPLTPTFTLWKSILVRIKTIRAPASTCHGCKGDSVYCTSSLLVSCTVSKLMSAVNNCE